jgi:hypothetical protein
VRLIPPPLWPSSAPPTVLSSMHDPHPPLGAEVVLLPGGLRGRRRRCRFSLGLPRSRPSFPRRLALFRLVPAPRPVGAAFVLQPPSAARSALISWRRFFGQRDSRPGLAAAGFVDAAALAFLKLCPPPFRRRDDPRDPLWAGAALLPGGLRRRRRCGHFPRSRPPLPPRRPCAGVRRGVRCA